MEEVVDRYRGEICSATLRNWRSLKVGPLAELETWESKNMVICSPGTSKNG
jgi:hypothetical protein